MKKLLFFILTTCFLGACEKQPETLSIGEVAEKYVRLALAIDQYSPGFVDAYFGPEKWKPSGDPLKDLPKDEFIEQATTLISECEQLSANELTIEEKDRLEGLKKQLIAVKTKVEMIGGKEFSFDEEAQLLYDVQPPKHTEAYFDELLNQLDGELPGKGAISDRYLEYAKQFIIPVDLVDTVFKVAIAEARRRTNENMQLPSGEHFSVEYVTDKSWSGYNYYQGDGQSLIQLNMDFPIYIDRAIDLACHEGYPGHHVFMTLLDYNLYKDKGWVEYSVYPLFSPQSLIAEGSANYGIDVAFPGAERVQYEKEVLFPLAGMDSSKAVQYYAIQDLRAKLNYAGNEAARKYLNGEINRETAAKWLEKYLLYEPERALQRTRFFDDYRSYVINYNLGLDLVTKYVDAQGGTADQPEKRWDIVKNLLSNPPTPSSLEN